MMDLHSLLLFGSILVTGLVLPQTAFARMVVRLIW